MKKKKKIKGIFRAILSTLSYVFPHFSPRNIQRVSLYIRIENGYRFDNNFQKNINKKDIIIL